jgi:hypothetical protein
MQTGSPLLALTDNMVVGQQFRRRQERELGENAELHGTA